MVAGFAYLIPTTRQYAPDGPGLTIGALGTIVWKLLMPYYLILWSLYCIISAGLTHWVYTAIPDDELAERSLAGNVRFSWVERLLGAAGASTLALQAAVVSGMLALVVARSDQYEGDVFITVLALVSVAGSWLSVVYSYALHYLRLWAQGVAVDLRLHGDEKPKFVDFLYQAIGVATLLGGPMQWQTREGRKAVSLNAVLGLTFNTIVLAITVSLIVS